MEVTMDGRTALITGGSLGLGRATAIEFARSGANVAIAARREEVLEEAKAEIEAVAKGNVSIHPCDVTDADALKKLYSDVVAEHGQVDILMNNAGRSDARPFEEVTDEEWMDDLNLKLFANIRLSRLAFPQMKARNWGRIINVLAVSGKTPGARSTPTSVSRAAGMALTKVLAHEGAPYNVLVNALMIGVIVSDQLKRGYDAAKPNVTFEEFVTERGKNMPMGRFGRAEEFANLACLLASDKGSYINGTAINVDGGMASVV